LIPEARSGYLAGVIRLRPILLVTLVLGMAAVPALAAEDDDPPPDKQVEWRILRAEAYGRENPWDPVGLRELYLEAAQALEPGTPERDIASERARELDAKVKEAYRLLRDALDGPPALSTEQTRRLAHQLADDLENKHALIRRRAAAYLGRLRSDEVAHLMVPRLAKETDPEALDALRAALREIRGPKVCDELGTRLRSEKIAVQRLALELLAEILAMTPRQHARHPSIAIGYFAFSRHSEIVVEALSVLERAGGPGVWGLMNAITLRDHTLRLRVIRALGNTGEGRAADVLGTFLVFGLKGRKHSLKKAAADAIVKIGMPTIPWLLRHFEDPRRRQWTKFVVYKITGKSFEYADQLKAWWSRMKPKEEK